MTDSNIIKLVTNDSPNNDDDDDEYFEHKENDGFIHNKEKYVTEYGFGVGYEHSHLSGNFDSIRSELLYNALHSVENVTFQNLLIKAIKLQATALCEYKDSLFCKYFNHEYNIIRNESIGLRHILSVVIYTDLSARSEEHT
eukprot:342949_1